MQAPQTFLSCCLILFYFLALFIFIPLAELIASLYGTLFFPHSVWHGFYVLLHTQQYRTKQYIGFSHNFTRFVAPTNKCTIWVTCWSSSPVFFFSFFYLAWAVKRILGWQQILFWTAMGVRIWGWDGFFWCSSAGAVRVLGYGYIWLDGYLVAGYIWSEVCRVFSNCYYDAILG